MINVNCRQWLAEGEYRDELGLIERVEAILRKQGKRTRRSWWEAFAGTKHARPRFVEGIEFPIIAAIQKRQYGVVTPNAIQNNAHEKAPPPRPQARWGSHRPRRHKLAESVVTK